MKNKNWKTLGLSLLGFAVLVGGVSVIASSINRNDDGLVEVSPDFKRGSLNEQGKYVETNESIYTPEAFKCLGLEIELEFEKNITYEVFYYNEYGSYLSSSNVQTENYIAVLPEGATHCRIEITPDWSLIELEKDDEATIKWYEVNSYASQMTIKVWDNVENLEVLELDNCDDIESDYIYLYYESGMTWEDYIDSVYNNYGFYIVNDEVYLDSYPLMYEEDGVAGDMVLASDEILDNDDKYVWGI